MADYSRKFDASVTTAVSALTINNTTPTRDSGHIDISVTEGAHCYILGDFQTTPTDNLQVDFYGSDDGGTTYDITPFMTIIVSKNTDPNSVSVIVSGRRGFKTIGRRDGASSDAITYTFKYRRWKWTDA